MHLIRDSIYHQNLADNAVYNKFAPGLWMDYWVSTHIAPLFVNELTEALIPRNEDE